MQTIRRRKNETVTVTDCPHCGGSHAFNLQAVIEETLGVMHMMTTRIEIKSCAVTCPDKGQTLMVDVPVLLNSGQSLVAIK